MWKWAGVTLGVGLVSFLLTPVLWPMPPGIVRPTSTELPFLIILSVFESLSFGLGVAFLVFGYPEMRRMKKTWPRLSWAVYFSIAWSLVNWWPHDNFHRVIAGDLQKMIYVDYTFHLTLILGGAILAYAFFRLFASKSNH